MPVASAVARLLVAASEILTRWGRWYVFGAQAVVAYGVPRLSADVDVTILLRPDTPARFVEDMSTAGFRARVGDAEFIARTRVIPFVHEESGMPLDVVLAGSGLEDEFLARVHLIPIGGVNIPFLAIDDLIIAKVLAGRPKDVEDARALWQGHRDTLDEARIRAVLTQLEEALGQSDLVPLFESLQRQ